MNERQGRGVLLRCFRAAGYAIVEDFTLTHSGVTASLDGYDEGARVGYEFITTEAGDRAEFTPEVTRALEGAMRLGELRVFLVDEAEVTETSLEAAALGFLDYIKREQGGR